jgi:hypothetical protein
MQCEPRPKPHHSTLQNSQLARCRTTSLAIGHSEARSYRRLMLDVPRCGKDCESVRATDICQPVFEQCISGPVRCHDHCVLKLKFESARHQNSKQMALRLVTWCCHVTSLRLVAKFRLRALRGIMLAAGHMLGSCWMESSAAYSISFSYEFLAWGKRAVAGPKMDAIRMEPSVHPWNCTIWANTYGGLQGIRICTGWFSLVL